MEFVRFNMLSYLSVCCVGGADRISILLFSITASWLIRRENKSPPRLTQAKENQWGVGWTCQELVQLIFQENKKKEMRSYSFYRENKA